MTGSVSRPLRVIVCGTVFGRFYLRAVRALEPAFDLAGVLAKGSERSVACARDYGVPLYTQVDQLPADIDIACIVVRAGVAGGPGSELALSLLERGIHVLQEQPAHHDEIAACLRQADRYRVQYRLNSFYSCVEPVRRFLALADALRRRQRLLFVDAAGASQVLYPLIHILGRALGGLRPWAFADPQPLPERLLSLARSPMPFRSLAGVLAGVPVILRVQNQLDPADPDNHAHFLHRISVGTEGGILTLADTHGPVLWNPRLHVQRADDGGLLLDGPGTDRLDLPSASLVGPAAPRSFRQIFEETWADGIGHALRELAEDISTGAGLWTLGQYQLTSSRVWLEVTTRLGRPDLVRLPEPQPLSVTELLNEVIW